MSDTNAQSTSPKKNLLPSTETGVADAFCREYAGKIIYVPTFGWFFWNGRYWKLDDQTRIRYVIRKFCGNLNKQRYRSGGKFLIDLQRNYFFASVEQLAHSDPRMVVPQDKLDANLWLLTAADNTGAVTINLQTGEENSPDPKDYITKHTRVMPAKDEHCPWWEAHLKYVCTNETGKVDQDKIDFLQRMSGYFLTGSTKEEAMFFLFGDGQNGKTKFIEALLDVLGKDYAVTLPLNTMMAANKRSHQIPADIATLHGARLALGSEVPSNATWDEEKIKHLTGGDSITARKLYQQYFSFKPTHKLLIAGNAKPLLRVVDQAIKRRFYLVPFERKIENPNKNFGEMLYRERAGILRWMISGALAWQQRGLDPPESIRQQTDQYFADQDIVQQWIDQCCIVAPDVRDSSSMLYESWRTWCMENGETPEQHRLFSQMLERKKFRKVTIRGHRVFHGIKARLEDVKLDPETEEMFGAPMPQRKPARAEKSVQ